MVIVGGLHRGVPSRQATVTEDSAFASTAASVRAAVSAATTASAAAAVSGAVIEGNEDALP